MQADLQEAAQLVQDPEALKAAVVSLFQRYASGAEPVSVPQDALQALQR